MGLFDWTAPLFHRTLDRRWRLHDVAQLSGLLRPYVPPGGRLLDVGGGTGGLAVRLLPVLDATITILDPSASMLKRVPQRKSLAAVRGSVEDMPFQDGLFDAVVVSDAFHHFRDLTAAVRQMIRVTREGGGVVILEIDPSGWRRPLVWGEKLLGEPGNFFAQEDFCTFMTAQGAPGLCVKHGSLGYYYVGTVSKEYTPGGHCCSGSSLWFRV